MLTKEELIAFEADIANEFNAGKIRAPIHLSGGNEDALIAIFKCVQESDWVCTTWRSHYHCLLKGVPQDQLKADIMAGKSITLCYPEHRIVSSAIVGGIIPIALGLAWASKNNGSNDVTWCFIGDMTGLTGIADECARYAAGHGLPLRIVVENNGLSVCTETENTWGEPEDWRVRNLTYDYKLPWPHAGTGKRIEF